MRRIALFVAFAIAAMSAIAGSAAATTTTTIDPTTRQGQVDQQLSDLQGQIEDATVAQLQAQKDLNSAISKQNVLANQINGLQPAIDAAQTKVNNAQNKLNAAEVAVNTSQNEAEAKQQQVNDSVARVREQAAQLIAGKADDSVSRAVVVLNASSISEMSRRQTVMNVVADQHKNVLDINIELKKQAQVLADKALAARDEAQKERDAVAQIEAKLQEQRGLLANLNFQAQSEAKQKANLIQTITGQKVEYQNQIIQLQYESNNLADLLRNRPHGDNTGPTNGIFAFSIPGAPITSPFGPRVHPIFGDIRMHTGVDFGAASGTPIHAAGDGTVVFSGVQTGYGNTIVIDHGNGLATLYAHQSVLFAQNGQSVKTGDIIGLVGMTGYATGPHLHFEVRVNGTPVDPMSFLA